ncbi:MAG: hypothetical protein WB816_15925 [Methylocystis sp.]
MTRELAALGGMILEMELIVRGGETWLDRARDREIKRSPDVIARREQRLVVQNEILEFLRAAREDGR